MLLVLVSKDIKPVNVRLNWIGLLKIIILAPKCICSYLARNLFIFSKVPDETEVEGGFRVTSEEFKAEYANTESQEFKSKALELETKVGGK